MNENSETQDAVTKTDLTDVKDHFQRKCSIIISLIASLLLLNGLGAQNASGDAAFQNASAINTYAFFQAKNIRQNDLTWPRRRSMRLPRCLRPPQASVSC